MTTIDETTPDAPGSELETGWDPTTPAGDTILRQAVDNTADRIETFTLALGGTVSRSDDVVLGRSPSTNWFANPGILRRPISSDIDAEAFRTQVERFFEGQSSFAVMSPFPLPRAAWEGWDLVGHPPFMVRPPGPSTLSGPSTGTVAVEEVTTAGGLIELERAAIEAFPIDGASDEPSQILAPSLVGGATRFFVVREDDRVVATSSVHIAHGVGTIEIVATRPEVRGRGYGAAVTDAATLAEPDLPAVLIASDPGRPVYERLGYVPICRWTLVGRL